MNADVQMNKWCHFQRIICQLAGWVFAEYFAAFYTGCSSVWTGCMAQLSIAQHSRRVPAKGPGLQGQLHLENRSHQNRYTQQVHEWMNPSINKSSSQTFQHWMNGWPNDCMHIKTKKWTKEQTKDQTKDWQTNKQMHNCQAKLGQLYNHHGSLEGRVTVAELDAHLKFIRAGHTTYNIQRVTRNIATVFRC